MPPNPNNYYYVLADLDKAPQGKEKRQAALKQHQQAKKSKAKQGNKVKDPVVPCPYANPTNPATPPPPAAKNAADIPCKYTTLKVSKSGEKGGSIESGSKNNVKVLQVKAGSKNKPATIECSLIGISGPCSKHEGKTFSYSEDYKEKTSSKLKFDAFSSLTILNYPWKCSPIKYAVNANTCDKKVRTRVEVFPDTELSVKLSLDFSKETESTTENETHVAGIESSNLSYSSIAESQSKEGKVKREGGINIEGAFKHDGNEFSIKSNFKELYKQVEDFNEFKASFSSLLVRLGQNPISKAIVYQGHKLETKKSKITITWPSLALELKGNWEEDGAECKYQGELSLGFSPLISAEVEIDLVEKFFAATPLGVVKKVLELANLEALNLMLKIKGGVSGNAALVIKREKETTFTPKGSIEGELEVSVEAILVKSKGKFLWLIDVDAEASISAESGIKCKIEGEKRSEIGVEIEFTGVQVFFVAKASLGISWSNQKAPPGAEEEPKPKKEEEEEEDDKPSENKIFLFEIDSKVLYDKKFDLS